MVLAFPAATPASSSRIRNPRTPPTPPRLGRRAGRPARVAATWPIRCASPPACSSWWRWADCAATKDQLCRRSGSIIRKTSALTIAGFRRTLAEAPQHPPALLTRVLHMWRAWLCTGTGTSTGVVLFGRGLQELAGGGGVADRGFGVDAEDRGQV